MASGNLTAPCPRDPTSGIHGSCYACIIDKRTPLALIENRRVVGDHLQFQKPLIHLVILVNRRSDSPDRTQNKPYDPQDDRNFGQSESPP